MSHILVTTKFYTSRKSDMGLSTFYDRRGEINNTRMIKTLPHCNFLRISITKWSFLWFLQSHTINTYYY